MAALTPMVDYCNSTLRIDSIPDYDGACNGLQVENNGKVTRIAAAVDASLATVRMAAEAGADLLVVHHGLFWGPSHPWTGKRRELIQCLVENNLAVYSAHLPLDAHPALGNNALLCKALGFKKLKPFCMHKGEPLGYRVSTRISREDLVSLLAEVVGKTPILLPGGSEECREIGVVTGGAGSRLKDAAAEGVDTFITGEGPHHTFGMAEDCGINVLYGGHYATETFGVKALAESLSKKFKVPWMFLDHPSGL